MHYFADQVEHAQCDGLDCALWLQSKAGAELAVISDVSCAHLAKSVVAFVCGKTGIACQKDRTPSNARLIGVIIFILTSRSVY